MHFGWLGSMILLLGAAGNHEPSKESVCTLTGPGDPTVTDGVVEGAEGAEEVGILGRHGRRRGFFL